MNINEKLPPTVSPSVTCNLQPSTFNSALPSPDSEHSNTPILHHSVSALEALPDEVWTWLLKDAEEFAGKLIKRYRWRGAKGGVLSGGFDANSIAAQAVTELFQPIEPNPSQTAVY